MQYKVNVAADNRDINISISAKKEDGEPDFFESIGKIFESSTKGIETDIIDVEETCGD